MLQDKRQRYNEKLIGNPTGLSNNEVFGKIGRFASEEVVLKIIHSKCVPILLYGLEACPLNKADLNSLDFVINRFFTARRFASAILATAFPSVCPSVRLSVCPSVTRRY